MSSVTKPRFFVAALLGAFLLIALCLAGCANDDKKNLAQQNTSENARVVNFFSPMEKVKADTENTARTASDRTISMAEDELGLEVAYTPIRQTAIRIKPTMRCVLSARRAIKTICIC